MATHPANVSYWDMDAAVTAASLDYAEQALAFALQGLVNQRSGPPRLMFKAGFADFDWPLADPYWRTQLEKSGRVRYTDLPSTLCGLVERFSASDEIKGAVLYDSALPDGTGYTLAMALSLGAQEGLLPMTAAVRSSHSCLAGIPLVRDLRVSASPQLASRASAWRWAIDTLLPKASRTRIFNLYHYTKSSKSDPQ